MTPPSRTAEHWREVFDAADHALELDSEERRVYLERCRRERSAIAAELDALIAAAAEPSVLEEPAAAFAEPFLHHDAGDDADDEAAALADLPMFGPYRVRCELGTGGMGAVYLAERSDAQYRKDVALKVLPRWSGRRKRRIERFLEERQILATLDHPGIARLLDGGVTPDGLPWFAMEYINGEHIDDYCDRRQLSIEERLELFCAVCAAVQHAHRNLVVHRDLKPSNILVARDGRVALVDFGIARLLMDDEEAASPALTTIDRQLTPLFASPEQIRGEPVSTASDVYALGVLLHALLTGSNPYRLSSFEGYEVARAVLETEPEAPSASAARHVERFAWAERASHATSMRRAGTPDRLSRRLRGDLDAIVLTAMAREPARRYPTVEQLEADVRRHLAGLPVLARPGGRLYHAGKFARRHTVGVTLGIAAAALVLTFATVMAVQGSRIRAQADRIALERDRARAVSTRLLSVFGSVAPEARGVSPRDILDSAAAHVTQLDDSPDEQARLMLGMAQAYHRAGLEDRARAMAMGALARRRARDPSAAHATAEALDLLGTIDLARGDLTGADSALTAALAIRGIAGARASTENTGTLRGLSEVRRRQRRYGESQGLARDAMAVDAVRGASGRAGLAQDTRALARVLADAGDTRGAVTQMERAVALVHASDDDDGAEAASMALELGTALHRDGRHVAADSVIQQGLAIERRFVAASRLNGVASGSPVSRTTMSRSDSTLRRALATRPPATMTDASLIVFVSDRDGPDPVGNLGNQEIYVMHADGTDARRLTNDPALDYAPAISRDGRHVAFTSVRTGAHEIFVMDTDGSHLQQVTHFGERGLGASQPAWSPDGRRIAFRGHGNNALWVMNVDGTGLLQLTDGSVGASSPTWSPDGGRIAYQSRRDAGPPHIFVMTSEGRDVRQLTMGDALDGRPAWSPDGKRIVFHSERDGDREIYVMNADGTHPARLTVNPAEDGNASWSPDGRRIVFYRRVLGHHQLFVMNADGSGVHRLTELSPVSFNSFPSWGPAAR